MHLHEDVNIPAYGIANRFDILNGRVLNILAHIRAPRAWYGVEFHRCETHLNDFLSAFGKSQWICASRPTVGIHANLAPTGATQQHMDRHACDLSSDVPHRLLDTTESAPQVHRAPPTSEVVISDLHEVLDVPRVAPYQVALQLVNVSGYLGVSIRLRVRLTPAIYALIGLDLHKAKVFAPTTGVGQKMLYVRYFHLLPPRRCKLRPY